MFQTCKSVIQLKNVRKQSTFGEVGQMLLVFGLCLQWEISLNSAFYVDNNNNNNDDINNNNNKLIWAWCEDGVIPARESGRWYLNIKCRDIYVVLDHPKTHIKKEKEKCFSCLCWTWQCTRLCTLTSALISWGRAKGLCVCVWCVCMCVCVIKNHTLSLC